ncbi:MAG: hypothetical protein Q4C70_07950, partial [Planctomycetia bacterium]|nr:hypothetical protein [Planctomycetia bacterium]
MNKIKDENVINNESQLAEMVSKWKQLSIPEEYLKVCDELAEIEEELERLENEFLLKREALYELENHYLSVMAKYFPSEDYDDLEIELERKPQATALDLLRFKPKYMSEEEWEQNFPSISQTFKMFNDTYNSYKENPKRKMMSELQQSKSCEKKKIEIELLMKLLEDFLYKMPGYKRCNTSVPTDELEPFMPYLIEYNSHWDEFDICNLFRIIWNKKRPCVIIRRNIREFKIACVVVLIIFWPIVGFSIFYYGWLGTTVAFLIMAGINITRDYYYMFRLLWTVLLAFGGIGWSVGFLGIYLLAYLLR